jgi:hypothetical protein
MELKWKNTAAGAAELHIYGEQNGRRRTTYAANIRYVFNPLRPPEDGWMVRVHEYLECSHLENIQSLRFASRSSAMRETRKRFTAAWIGASDAVRAAAWDRFA